MKAITYFRISKENDFNIIKERIELQKFKLVQAGKEEYTQKLYDTFDWRLMKQNCIVAEQDDSFNILDLEKNSIISTTLDVPGRNYLRSTDFKDEKFKRQLEKTIKIRALFLYTKIIVECNLFRVLNQDEKIISFIRLYNYSIIGKITKNDNCFFNISAVKGYAKETNRMMNTLKFKKKLLFTNSRLYNLLLTESGFSPFAYSSKINLKIYPSESIVEVLRKIFHSLSRIMQLNVDGLIKDIDTEFLHDFRISVRRTRTAFSQFSHILQSEKLIFFNDFFKYLVKSTNRLRDLDVFLHNKEVYFKMLPEKYKSSLYPFFKMLSQERRSELTKVKRILHSDEFIQNSHQWDDYLASEFEKENLPIEIKSSIRTEVSKLLINQYKRIIKFSLRAKSSDDKSLHNLRIECKKLRYLIEFFKTLFNKESTTLFIKELKSLQDKLGSINDIVIQIAEMERFLLQAKGSENIQTSTALGMLIAYLTVEKGKIQTDLAKVLDKFTSTLNDKRFKSIFSI